MDVRKSIGNVFSGVEKDKSRNLLSSEIYNDLYNHFTNIKGRRAYLKFKKSKGERRRSQVRSMDNLKSLNVVEE